MRLRGCLVEAERLLDVHGHQNSAVEKLRDFNRFADLRIQQKVEAVFKKIARIFSFQFLFVMMVQRGGVICGFSRPRKV